MKILYTKVDKQEIATFPVERFEGPIIEICHEREANRAVEFLLRQTVLGMDTETRPSFKKGVINKVSLLQVSTHDECFLFRLNKLGITTSILQLLSDKTVLKVGLSLRDDFMKLHEMAPFTPGRFVDLQAYAKTIGIEDQSLQKIYANLFHKRISKGQRLSNWEAEPLTESQKRYAATDAWACIRIFEELNDLKGTHEFYLKDTDEEGLPLS